MLPNLINTVSRYQDSLSLRLQNLHRRVRRDPELNRAGRTPFDIIDREEIVSLRYYPGEGAQDRCPIVIVPPLAVNMLIYDLFPERSVVAWFRDRGHPVYLIDWGRPGRAQAHYRFETYLTRFMPRMLDRVREHSGQNKLTLHGWSIGAMLSYAYAALGDPDIEQLILLGPPCDYHAEGMANRRLAGPFQAIGRATGWHPQKSPAGIWHVPGWVNSLAYKAMTPQGTIRGYMDLLSRLGDAEYVSDHVTQAAFLDDMVAYPGGVMQDIVRFLMTENVLARGRLPISGCRAGLDDITSRVLIVIGDRDPIITRSASQKLVNLMSKASCDMLEVPGGHMSIVSGRQAPKEIWPRIDDWLARHEGGDKQG